MSKRVYAVVPKGFGTPLLYVKTYSPGRANHIARHSVFAHAKHWWETLGEVDEKLIDRVHLTDNYNFARIETLKDATGIKCANCDSCSHLGSDSDGNYPEVAIEWPICKKFPKYEDYKNFPFRHEMDCWDPEFWHSKFAGEIKEGSSEEVCVLARQFADAVNNGIKSIEERPRRES